MTVKVIHVLLVQFVWTPTMGSNVCVHPGSHLALINNLLTVLVIMAGYVFNLLIQIWHAAVDMAIPVKLASIEIYVLQILAQIVVPAYLMEIQ